MRPTAPRRCSPTPTPRSIGPSREAAIASRSIDADLGSVQRRLDDEQDLREALADDQIVAWFQPEVDLETGRIVGAEALARWIHPTRGVIDAGHFMPLAEDAGLVFAIDDRVVASAVELRAGLRARASTRHFASGATSPPVSWRASSRLNASSVFSNAPAATRRRSASRSPRPQSLPTSQRPRRNSPPHVVLESRSRSTTSVPVTPR